MPKLGGRGTMPENCGHGGKREGQPQTSCRAWCLSSLVAYSVVRGNTTGIHEGMDLGDDRAGVGLVLSLALAGPGAIAFECPHEADLLAQELGDLSLVPFHRGSDRREGRPFEAAHEARVRLSIEGGGRSGLDTRRGVQGGDRATSVGRSSHPQHGVPRTRKSTEAVRAVGEDDIHEVGKVGQRDGGMGSR